ncbi:hypothetical protein CYMTET_10548, partial [Cymbomonas tetramitiformis]
MGEVVGVGQRIEIYWPDEDSWFPGTLVDQRNEDGKVLSKVEYDDGDEETLNLADEKYRLLTDSGRGDANLHVDSSSDDEDLGTKRARPAKRAAVLNSDSDDSDEGQAQQKQRKTVDDGKPPQKQRKKEAPTSNPRGASRPNDESDDEDDIFFAPRVQQGGAVSAGKISDEDDETDLAAREKQRPPRDSVVSTRIQKKKPVVEQNKKPSARSMVMNASGVRDAGKSVGKADTHKRKPKASAAGSKETEGIPSSYESKEQKRPKERRKETDQEVFLENLELDKKRGQLFSKLGQHLREAVHQSADNPDGTLQVPHAMHKVCRHLPTLFMLGAKRGRGFMNAIIKTIVQLRSLPSLTIFLEAWVAMKRNRKYESVKTLYYHFREVTEVLAFCPDPVFGLRALDMVNSQCFQPSYQEFVSIDARKYLVKQINFLVMESLEEIKSSIERPRQGCVFQVKLVLNDSKLNTDYKRQKVACRYLDGDLDDRDKERLSRGDVVLITQDRSWEPPEVDEMMKDGPEKDEQLQQKSRSLVAAEVKEVFGRRDAFSMQLLQPLNGAKSGMVITVIRGPSKVTYERQVKALRMLTTHGFRNKHMQEALLSVRQPDRRDLDDTFNKGTRRIWDEAQAMEETKLNSDQEQAVRLGTSGQGITLIQGPPGTGKTTSALRIIIMWLHSTAQHAGTPNILVTGFSNVAVDNIWSGLRERDINALRVRGSGGAVCGATTVAGADASVRGGVQLDGTIQHAVMNHPKTATAAMLRHNKRSEEANVIEKEIQNEVINRAAVVCATCMTAGSDLLNTSTFTHVLLDEATQSTEAASLVPIVNGSHTLVLI